jgi:hypothetical protein
MHAMTPASPFAWSSAASPSPSTRTTSGPFRHDTPRFGEFQPKFASFHGPQLVGHILWNGTFFSIKNDPSQLRNTVYELARTKLGVPLAGCLRDRLAHRFAQAAWCRLHPTTSLQEGIQPQSRSRTRVPQRGAIRAETGAACSTSALAPILFGFPLHRGCIRVLALDPVRRAP